LVAPTVAGATPPTDAALTQREVRELWAFLHGDIMIGGIRQHLRRAMGLCARHSWGYAQVEIELWTHGAGDRGGHQPFDVCVLYETLADDVAHRLRTRHAPWTRDLRGLVVPTDSCRICDVLVDTATGSGLPGLADRDAAMRGYGGLDLGRSTVEANAATWTARWCHETEPIWRPRACPECVDELPGDDARGEATAGAGPGLLCRVHLGARPLAPAEARHVGAALDQTHVSMIGLLRTMTKNGPSATPEENASWIEALGWFASWSLPLKLTSAHAARDADTSEADR